MIIKRKVPADQQPGRPRILSKKQEEELADTVENKTPSDVGFSSEMNWTSPLLQQWIKENFQIPVSDSHIRETLYRLNFSYTMPTYVLAKADPLKQVAFLEKFKELREQVINGEIDKLLFVDESMIRDYQALSRIWFPVGKQKKIKTFGKHWGAKLIGSLDYETGEVFCRTYEQYTAKEFLSFLKSVVFKYRKKKITLILDNAKIHHAELIQPFLEQHKDVLTLVFLPPYSPNLNLIEGLWGWLKESVVNNVFFQSVKEIKAEVFKFVEKINLTPLETVDRLCLKLEKFMQMSNDAIIADLL